MKQKRPFYKNGMIIGVALFALALGITQNNPNAGAVCGLTGIVMFFVSLVRKIIKKIKGKNKKQDVFSVPDNEKPVQTPIQQPQNVAINETVNHPTPEPKNTNEVSFKRLSIKEFRGIAAEKGFVVFDFETTGLSPKTECITEIGAIKIGPDGEEIDRYSTLVNPQKHIPSRASEKTGITDSMVRKAPIIDEVLPTFISFIDDYPIIAYNVSFDQSFLEAAALHCNIGCSFKCADALQWAKKTYDLPSYKQDDVAGHIHFTPTISHRAIADCETLVVIIKDMMLRTPIDGAAKKEQANSYKPVPRAKRELNINEDEQAIADHFIDVILKQKPEMNPVLERRSESYISLCQGETDFLRIKFTSRARWISIDSWAAELEEDDPLFEAQTNKRQRHWKAKLDDISDIEQFDDYVVRACK